MLEVRDLQKVYPMRGGGRVQAVRGISFVVPTGSTLGIVGESGCGKSTMARMLVGLEAPTSGTVLVDGEPYAGRLGRRQRAARRRVQMVFQDPHSSLNERLTVGATLREVLAVNKVVPRAKRPARVRELLGQVGLAASMADRYPHELSGGQRQRVGIARALAVDPRILVLDEPVSALDVSVRAEVMNLLIRLRDELGLTYVFISHDLSMVRHISDRVAVMYLGRIVETGPWQAVSDRPRHPYTQALHDAVPIPDPGAVHGDEFPEIRGELPDPAHPPSGCPFHTRCPLAEDACVTTDQVLTAVAADHTVACRVVTGAHREHHPEPATAGGAETEGGADEHGRR